MAKYVSIRVARSLVHGASSLRIMTRSNLRGLRVEPKHKDAQEIIETAWSSVNRDLANAVQGYKPKDD